MSQRNDVTGWVFDQWQFIVFAVGGALAFWLGTKKSEWQLQRAIKDIEELKERVRASERMQSEESTSISRMAAALDGISHNQERILNQIADLHRDKVDK